MIVNAPSAKGLPWNSVFKVVCAHLFKFNNFKNPDIDNRKHRGGHGYIQKWVKQNLFFVGDAFGSESSSITYMKMYIKNGARDIQ